MNFINLRNVSNQEIHDTYSAILRISPTDVEGVKLDDPTPLLYTVGKEVKLSDSAGNFLNITFVPQVCEKCKVNGFSDEINLINVTQKVPSLYCVEALRISPTLHIDNELADKSPLQIINEDGILLFPAEAPDDDAYLNHNGKIDFNVPEDATQKRINKIFDNLWADDEIYTSEKYEDYHVKVNGKKIYRLKPPSEIPTETGDKEVSSFMVPELYKNDYVLGHYAGHTYKPTRDDLEGKNNSKISGLTKNIIDRLDANPNAKVTELSFVEIEKIIWSSLEGAMKGSQRSFDGRYKNLFPTGAGEEADGTENKLFNDLFAPLSDEEYDEDALENLIRQHSPLVGISIQPGIICYNSIPFRRYLFHLLRRYKDIDNNTNVYTGSGIRPSDFITYSYADASSSFMHNLTTEYALCDGRKIKEVKDGVEGTDYPALNRRNTNWSSWTGANTNEATNIYDAISLSAADIENAASNIVYTPRLFELDQYSLRYLRGLNWRRIATYDRFIDESGHETTREEWPYNNQTMLVETDGSFIINDWYSKNAEIHPKIKDNKVDYEFVNNELPQCLPGLSNEDVASIPKNIHKVGVYYANYDYKICNTYRHVHQIAVDENLLKNGDSLYKASDYYMGETDFNAEVMPAWSDYVNLKSDTFLGSYAMRSIQNIELDTTDISRDELIRKIQDLPISYKGGTSSAIRKVISGYKAGSRVMGRCVANKIKSVTYYLGDGGYKLSAWRPRIDGTKEGWRLLSSLQTTNKYTSNDINQYGAALNDDEIIHIDDKLPMPPSINFIPLMKI